MLWNDKVQQHVDFQEMFEHFQVITVQKFGECQPSGVRVVDYEKLWTLYEDSRPPGITHPISRVYYVQSG
jgi:hypothetical protein